MPAYKTFHFTVCPATPSGTLHGRLVVVKPARLGGGKVPAGENDRDCDCGAQRAGCSAHGLCYESGLPQGPSQGMVEKEMGYGRRFILHQCYSEKGVKLDPLAA